MGHASSKSVLKKSALDDATSQKELDSKIVQIFENFANGERTVTCSHFTNAFGEDLGSVVWKYLSDSASEKVSMDANMFSRRFLHLFDPSPSSFVELLLPAEHLVRICAQCAGVELDEHDEFFIAVVSNEMERAGSSAKASLQWISSNCPHLWDAVQNRLKNVFLSAELINMPDNCSNVLSSLQMWFLRCSLPEVYFASGSNEGIAQRWTPLYSSFEQGISATRFEQCVFCYRGPTVTIIEMKDSSIVVLAVDQEWRNSGLKFGDTNCVFLQLAPLFKRTMKGSPLYCNFKLRSQPRKLFFEGEFELDSELSGIANLETFGCGSVEALKGKKIMDERQRKQVERNKKVPLPGEWEDNPDKLLLELAGVYSTDNRREVIDRRDAQFSKNSM